MGVIYKLKSEVKNYILEQKKVNPNLSCRGLASLIENKFQIKVSKSSINSIIKEAGLSMPVGRRRKKRRRRLEMPVKPSIEVKVEAPVELTIEKPIEVPLLEGPATPIEKPIEAPIKPPEEPIEKPVEVSIKPPEMLAEKPIEAPIKPPEEPIETPVEGVVEKPPEMPVKEPIQLPVEKPPEKPLEIPLEKPAEERIPEPTKAPPGIPAEVISSGAILLKAADYLLGGSYQITEAIQKRLKTSSPELLAKTEATLYAPLFGFSANSPLKSDCGLWPLINQRFTSEEITSYLNELQEVTALAPDISRIISSLFQEVRGIKVTLSDGALFYLDGQLHTIWSAPQVPYDFSSTLYNVKSYIKKYFQEDAPFVLFIPPGFDTPTKEFFDFIFSLEAQKKKIRGLALYGNKFEGIEDIHLEQTKKCEFVFGLWPWQFGQFRKVKNMGNFRLLHFEPLNKDFYLAEGQVELLQPDMHQRVTLRASFLKTNLNEKIRLLILSNLSADKVSLEGLAEVYLSHWPNLEETFQDFSRKIELFTYMASSQRFFSMESLNLNKAASPDLNTLFNQYLKVLDLYVRWHFLPSDYEDRDFSTMKEQFYELKAIFNRQRDYLQVTFQPHPGFALLKDLEYACRRLNEKEIVSPDGRRLWFLI